MRSILEKLVKGEITIEEAEETLESQIINIQDKIRFDITRKNRTGFPEAVFAPGKSNSDLVEIIKNLGPVIVTRLEKERFDSIKNDLGALGDKGLVMDYHETARVLVVREDFEIPEIGKIGIITAGTSDIPVAEEARVIAETSGCEVMTAYDAGVAGLHRLIGPLVEMKKYGVKVLIVVAGMEGALPSVVAGMVDIPVIGVPTSVGYGVGEGGVTALHSMLQSCSPGIGVVNIDNGFGAAVLAVKILKLFND